MEQVTVENFRCFREKQTARLAPLTLLVGDNSTGKTSFLALIRALWDMGFRQQIPDFKEDPYDLGSFAELANIRALRATRSVLVKAGFVSSILNQDIAKRKRQSNPFEFDVSLTKAGTTPIITQRMSRSGDLWVEEFFEKEAFRFARAGTAAGSWQWDRSSSDAVLREFFPSGQLPFFYLFPSLTIQQATTPDRIDFKPLNNSSTITRNDWQSLYELGSMLARHAERDNSWRPFASAPIRSRPRRTYDPSRATPDAHGDYIPMYLADTYSQDKEGWTQIKGRIESFGKTSGLFDEISIKDLSKGGSGPFQLQVRKFGHRLKGSPTNLIDVGYGVSQILPVIIEILREGGTPMFLLQQPEVHLHPSAQAALGSFFCEKASWQRQIIIETHSDYLLNRIRMDVCEGKGQLKPEDISILFFERVDLDVRIHSIRIDNNGNIIDQPPGYRQFFNDEMRRSLRV